MHPERVTELILRGIFLLRNQEIDWFYQRGASALYPDAWEPYIRLNDARRAVTHHLRQRDRRRSRLLHPTSKRVVCVSHMSHMPPDFSSFYTLIA